jgi:hypothetical protein
MAIKTAASARTLPGTYFDHVKRFPLTHVRDDAHLEEATAVIDRLLREDLDEGGQEYLDALTDLVEIYEADPRRPRGGRLARVDQGERPHSAEPREEGRDRAAHHLRRPERHPVTDQGAGHHARQVLPRLAGRLPPGVKQTFDARLVFGGRVIAQSSLTDAITSSCPTKPYPCASHPSGSVIHRVDRWGTRVRRPFPASRRRQLNPSIVLRESGL